MIYRNSVLCGGRAAAAFMLVFYCHAVVRESLRISWPRVLPVLRQPLKLKIASVQVDDQDKAYNSSSPKYQPAVHKHLRSKGVEFDAHYVTTPVCCPSRTNILLGKYSHNTNMTDVFPPHGECRPQVPPPSTVHAAYASSK